MCSTCGGSAAAAPATPYEVKLPDGTTATVKNKTEERVARDQAFVRMRQSGKVGYTVTR
jgi:hypothetical protein